METLRSLRIASSASFAAPSGRERSASATSARNTFAPSFSSASAMPRPMPLPAPVTSALSPSRSKAGALLEVGRRVNHHDARALAGHGELVHHIGREKARLARAHIELLVGHFDVRGAFQEIADLLDAGVGVRQRALAPLDLADQHLDLAGADGVRSDEAEIAGAGVVGGGVRGELAGPDQVTHGLSIPRLMPVTSWHSQPPGRSARLVSLLVSLGAVQRAPGP